MRHQMQSFAFGKREYLAEPLRRAARLAAADPERNYAAILPRGGPFGDLPRRLDSELPDGVEDPARLYRGLRAGRNHRVEDRSELLLLPQHDARGDDDLGVADV